jgi:hypothetical protein
VAGEPRDLQTHYDRQTGTLRLAPLTLALDEGLVVTLHAAADGLMRREDYRLTTLQRMLDSFRLQTSAKMGIAQRLPQIIEDPMRLARYTLALSESQLRALLETILDAGVEHNDHSGKELLVLWNNNDDERVTHRLSVQHRHRWMPEDRFRVQQGTAPRFKAMSPDRQMPDSDWQLVIHLSPLLSLTLKSSP